MKILRKSLPVFCCLCTLLFLSGTADTANRKADDPGRAARPFEQSLERLLSAGGRAGVMLVSLPSGRVELDYRSGDPLVPASVVKLLTTYAALKKLGPSFRFPTEMYAAVQPSDGVVRGDIWIKGYGDPLFDFEKAGLLARELKEHGIRRITGGIFTDESFFEPAAEQVCLDRDCVGAYNPVVSAAAADFNMLTLRVAVPKRAGKPVMADAPAAEGYARVRCSAVSGKKGGSLRVKSTGAVGNGQEGFQVTGQGASRGPRVREYRFHAADPAGLFAHTVRVALERAGIRVEGRDSRRGTVPAGAVLIARCESEPLSELIADINKYSNNFMAEMLLRGLGAHEAGPPGTTEKGVAAVRAVLDQVAVPERAGMIDCGSGLSRFCLVSPGTFCRLLVAAWRDAAVGADFLSSLAVNSGEGTLRRRMAKPGLTVRGKTGTLSDVIGFAGYVTGPAGKTFAASIILNDVRDRAGARRAIDSFLEDVAFSG